MTGVMARIGLGVAAVLPLLITAAIAVVPLAGIRITGAFSAKVFFFSIIGGLIVYFVIWTYFLYAVQVNDRLDASAKTRWTLILIFAEPIGAIAFWYLFIWRTGDSSQTSA